MPSPPLASLEFRPLFDAHLAFVERVLRRFGVPDRELEDARQEVFLIVHRKLAEFEGRASVRTWVYAIASRVARMTRRKAYLRCELLAPPPAEPQVDAGQEVLLAQRGALASVVRVLGAMDPEKREAFVLYELEGMSVAEVASTTGVPESTALYRLHRAREELTQKLKRARLLSEVRSARPPATARAGRVAASRA